MSITPRHHQTKTKEGINSWYLKTGDIHHFICKCGEVEQCQYGLPFIIYHPYHQCQQCGNDYFIDSEKFLYHPNISIYIAIQWEYLLSQEGNEWDVSYVIPVPTLDMQRQKIVMHKIEVYFRTLGYGGSDLYEAVEYDLLQRKVYNGDLRPKRLLERIEKDSKEVLLRFIENNPHEKIEWLLQEEEYIQTKDIEKRLEMLAFFLKFEKIKEYEYFYWYKLGRFYRSVFDTEREDFEKVEDVFCTESIKAVLHGVCNFRKEKSVKRACFEAYEEAIKYKHYDPLPDIIFSRYISDPNLLVRLILLDVRLKHLLFKDLSLFYIRSLVEVLLERYGQKALVEIFEKLSLQTQGRENLRDTCWMIAEDRTILERTENILEGVPANMEAIHNAFVRFSNRYYADNMEQEFVYLPHQKRAEVTVGDLTFKLPKTVNTLNNWASRLRNCMFGYTKNIMDQQTIIYGVEKNDRLTYAVEIQNGKIVQAKGKYNQEIDKEDMEMIEWWLTQVQV